MPVYNLSESGKLVTWKEWKKHGGSGISAREYGAVCSEVGLEDGWIKRGVTLGDIAKASKIAERELARYAMERWARADLVKVEYA